MGDDPVAAEAKGWGQCIVIYGAVPYAAPRFAAHHLADNLAHYAPVLYVDPPLSRLEVARAPELRPLLEGPRLSMVTPRLANLRVLLFPGKDRPTMTRLSTWLLRRRVGAALRALGARPLVTIVQPPHRPLLAGLRDQRRVYLVTDDYIAMATMFGFPAAHMSRGEARLAREADLIVVVSEVLADKFRAMGHEALVIPNGCDDVLFATTDTAPRPTDVTLPSPIVSFVGYLSNRIDFNLLDAVARRGHSVLLVGARSGVFAAERAEALMARPNVQWVGGKEYTDLPSYMRVTDVGVVPYPDNQKNRASFPLKILEYLAAGRRVVATDLPSYMRVTDVGVVPYPDNQKNRASFPLKILEYLAAGRRVVATDLPAVRWLDTGLVRIAPEEAEGFADAVEAALAEHDDVLLRERRRTFAAGHSWSRRTERLAAALDLTLPRPTAE